MHNHRKQNELIVEILSDIAQRKKKSLERVKCLLLINQNAAINREFWDILDKKNPNHGYEYVGCCAGCGLLELCKKPPHSDIHIY